ncbi:F-box/kelch-repeat protein, partial [Mucuna pruriens]
MSRPLPEELLVEILSWVSVKDLMRYRCVSKSWSSLIFDPTFIKLHHQKSSKNTHILLTFRDYENDESRYSAAPCSIHDLLENPSSTIGACHRFNHDYIVLGVCNGLVCLQDSYRGDVFEEYWVRFWNPATRVMSEESPHIRLCSSDYNYPYLFMFGFGYDDWSDTYQVVLLDNKSHQMENESYSYLSMPDGLFKVPPDVPALEILKGCLCLSHHHETHFVVWLMKEFRDEKSWTQLLNVGYEHLHIHVLHGFPTLPVILCMSRNDDTVLLANYDVDISTSINVHCPCYMGMLGRKKVATNVLRYTRYQERIRHGERTEKLGKGSVTHRNDASLHPPTICHLGMRGNEKMGGCRLALGRNRSDMDSAEPYPTQSRLSADRATESD